jgi:hypothetical protein
MTSDTAACPPLDQRITKSLLGYGVIAGPVYVTSVAAQEATRDGFDPTRHAASQLANGDFGWIQIATFLVVGAMTVAAAVGIRRALGPDRTSAWASGLIGAYGVALMVAGVVRADPSDGFPPGTPPGVGKPSWHGLGHLVVAGAGFLCLVAGCLVVAAYFSRIGDRRWAWFSRFAGVFLAAAFGFLASGSGAAAAVVSFTAAVVVMWGWLTAVSLRLYGSVGSP